MLVNVSAHLRAAARTSCHDLAECRRQHPPGAPGRTRRRPTGLPVHYFQLHQVRLADGSMASPTSGSSNAGRTEKTCSFMHLWLVGHRLRGRCQPRNQINGSSVIKDRILSASASMANGLVITCMP